MKSVNAVVIGAGAAGCIVAKELAVAGLGVVLLERGKWYTPHDCRKDDLRNQRTTVLGNAFGPDDDGNPRVIVDARGIARQVLPSDGAYQNNAACVGGGTLSYGAQAWRYMPQDFRMRSTYGAPEGSSLEDWPLGYDDLEPFYEKAEYEIGISGDYSATPFKGPRRRPLPMPPLPPNREYGILEPAARRLGLHPFPLPMARNSVPYNGRGPCMRCRWCCGFACEVDAKNGSQNTALPVALATGNCELRTESMVTQIVTDDRGRPRSVIYVDSHGNRQEQPADIVIVSACAIESARLLLNSKSRQFPQGLGNRYDQVGRHLQGHHYTGAIGYFDFETYDDVGPGASIAVTDYNHGNPGLCGGGMLANEFIRLPIEFVGSGVPGQVPGWGLAHKAFVRKNFAQSIVLKGPVQPMPVFDARVQLDPKVKDHWGIPVARLSGYRHPNDVEVGRFLAGKAQEWLQEAGAVSTWTEVPGPDFGGGPHQAGTCRMGNDPRTSVVDRYCRVHDMDNLFVVDASVHVTNGGFNPGLTIMAVAYCASAHMLKTWKG